MQILNTTKDYENENDYVDLILSPLLLSFPGGLVFQTLLGLLNSKTLRRLLDNWKRIAFWTHLILLEQMLQDVEILDNNVL